MKPRETIPRARIGVTDGSVFVVRDAYEAAGGWSFRHGEDTIPALQHERFQSTRNFIPRKLVRFVEEIPTRSKAGAA